MSERGSGLTTKQMREAPVKAIFVWCNENRTYPRALARYLGRTDLRILSPEAIEHEMRGFRGEVVVDHAARLTERQATELMRIRRRSA